MKIKGYTIESTSNEGIYYLINGWYKYFGFWIRKKDMSHNMHKITFKTVGQAKASLTKLLKIMEDYRTDTFKICGITENNNIIYIGDLKR